MTAAYTAAKIIIMSDKFSAEQPIGLQIRRLRQARGWTLAELARRAATSAPTLHRYENGWDNFELGTLRKIAAALGARLEVRLATDGRAAAPGRRPARAALVKLLSPLFWDRDLASRDLDKHPDWVLGRVLTSGNRKQVAAARRYYDDEAFRRALGRRGIDPKTRNYWSLILRGERSAL